MEKKKVEEAIGTAAYEELSIHSISDLSTTIIQQYHQLQQQGVSIQEEKGRLAEELNQIREEKNRLEEESRTFKLQKRNQTKEFLGLKKELESKLQR